MPNNNEPVISSSLKDTRNVRYESIITALNPWKNIHALWKFPLTKQNAFEKDSQ